MGNVSSYRVESAGFKNFTVTTVFANVTGLEPGTQYSLRVTALGANSVEIAEDIVTGYTNPEAVTSLTVRSTTTTSIFLQWSEPIGNVFRYRIVTIGNQGNNMTVSSLFANVTGLVPGNGYTLLVISLAANSVTEGTPVSIFNYTNPDTIKHLTVYNIRLTSISLQWDPPEGSAAAYRVESIGPSHSSITVSTLFTEISGLVPNSSYIVQVIAVAADSKTEGQPVKTSVNTGIPITTRIQASLLSYVEINEEMEAVIVDKLNILVQKYLPTNTFTLRWKGKRRQIV
nr:PREDICTED: receptor-type tyrosine-protein phosphatase eta-like [Lepisosteus oculatus]